ncbi:methylenetetrahydrofolate reductase [Actinoplanes sp. NPDC049596]|uniref:methylenetetrahydrofolate reductase n=1 Tax=unclassified Actinoplanes TaxID=2626549 RepID=UPI00341E76CE
MFTAALIDDFSVEITGRDATELEAVALPAGTRVNVTFLGHEDAATRLATARAIATRGLIAVPHLSARRLSSRTELASFLAALPSPADVFVVGGDPATPHGPFGDALSVIESGLLEEYGVERVSIAGYPEGHPGLPEPVLWSSLEAKLAALRARGLEGEIITQFGFDADPVLDWIAALRSHGIEVPVRVGVPGPAGAGRLLRYATRFGVRTLAANGLPPATPDGFLDALATDYHPADHGLVKLHFYPFGGLRATVDWIGATLLR